MWGCMMTLLLLCVLVFLVLLEVGCCFNASFCSVLLQTVQPLFSMRAFLCKRVEILLCISSNFNSILC